MRNWILKIHMYGLLLTWPYLILYGVSSLNFNHRDAGNSGPVEKTFWTRDVLIPDEKNDEALATALRDSLGLFGWYLPWETERDSTGRFHFEVVRPGRAYLMDAYPAEGRIDVESRDRGVWAILNLHAFMGVPGSLFLGLWKFYNEFSTWMILFGAISGVYLWTARKSERKSGLLVLAVCSICSIAFLLYLWLMG